MQHIPNVLVSLGPRGVLAAGEYRPRADAELPDSFVLFEPTPVPPEAVVNVTGAGDSFVAGFCAAWLQQTMSWPTCVVAGLQAAATSLRSDLPISPALDRRIFEAAMSATKRN